MRLRANEVCPIHRSVSCCGRDRITKPRLIRLGVQRVEDEHHPRGYRELRSPAEMRKLLNRKIREQAGICAICHEEFTDYNDVAPDHRNPKGMGGAWWDDHPDNIQADIGGATKKKDQQGWTADGRSSSLYSINLNIRVLMPQECASCVRAPGSNRHVVGNERVLQERSSEPS